MIERGTPEESGVPALVRGGQELTLTVLPQRERGLGETSPLVLPPVRRFGHDEGIAPYNGAVAVTANSEALHLDRRSQAPIESITCACAAAFGLVRARARAH